MYLDNWELKIKNMVQIFIILDEILTIPKFIRYHAKIEQIACGFEHSLFKTSNGQLYSMGSNAHGQLGLGSNVSFLFLF